MQRGVVCNEMQRDALQCNAMNVYNDAYSHTHTHVCAYSYMFLYTYMTIRMF